MTSRDKAFQTQYLKDVKAAKQVLDHYKQMVADPASLAKYKDMLANVQNELTKLKKQHESRFKRTGNGNKNSTAEVRPSSGTTPGSN